MGQITKMQRIITTNEEFWFTTFYWAGFTIAQRERAQEDFKVPYQGAPPRPTPIHVRKTATAPGDHPTLFE